MRTGIKLECGFQTHEATCQLFNNQPVLPYLVAAGVQAVETSVRSRHDDDILFDHARQCVEAGLRMSLHPYTDERDDNVAFFEDRDSNRSRLFHQRFFRLAQRVAELQQAETIVTLHPASATRQYEYSRLMERSCAFYEWARAWCERNVPGVQPVVELQLSVNPDEDRWRVGDRFDDLVRIAEAGGVPICWDFGHGMMNARRFDYPVMPGESFLERVVHVHCHDIDTEDHRPLLYDTVPWQHYLRTLVEHGFDGTVILEIPPEPFLAAGGLHTLDESFRRFNDLRRSLEAR